MNSEAYASGSDDDVEDSNASDVDSDSVRDLIDSETAKQ